MVRNFEVGETLEPRSAGQPAGRATAALLLEESPALLNFDAPVRRSERSRGKNPSPPVDPSLHHLSQRSSVHPAPRAGRAEIPYDGEQRKRPGKEIPKLGSLASRSSLLSEGGAASEEHLPFHDMETSRLRPKSFVSSVGAQGVNAALPKLKLATSSVAATRVTGRKAAYSCPSPEQGSAGLLGVASKATPSPLAQPSERRRLMTGSSRASFQTWNLDSMGNPIKGKAIDSSHQFVPRTHGVPLQRVDNQEEEDDTSGDLNPLKWMSKTFKRLSIVSPGQRRPEARPKGVILPTHLRRLLATLHVLLEVRPPPATPGPPS
ncbi:hypothetical protein CYMTET_22677 [Cymbomonas tetramitiformis]|uniref:Uncharacterized protein n=1 Tax=Cymbomonas tetramitiformis TaxID=36881 RepID=A0AAE0FZQ6_9CHLO|nr:hypothetical protein CYMTET_22677 [Cymbomonas tetramitiformis]